MNQEGTEHLRVLVADDAAIVRKIVTEMVEAAGHVVVGEAADGQEAVDLYETLRPDVLVLDLNMPKLDGLAAAEAIRRNYPGANLVLASVLLNETRLRRMAALGRVEIIAKPFDAAALSAALERVVATATRPT